MPDYNFNNIITPVLISELLSKAHLRLNMPCGGKGICGKCKVKVFGNVSGITEFEKQCLTENEIADCVRLACQTYVTGDVKLSLIQDEYAVPEFEKSSKRHIFAERIGAAADIGTTTVTAAVFDLDSGEMLCRETKLNPQNVFGADVISRLQKSLEGAGDELQSSVCSCVTGMLEELNPRRKPFDRIVLTGNTAMLYLLTNRNPKALTCAPFEADHLFGEEIEAKDLPEFSKLCKSVYLPRCVSAFVGADITCCALDASSRFDFLEDNGKAHILADIGTNGEIMLSYGEKLVCCSTAAGPAFEGATLHSGSVAKEGAIDSMSIDNGKISYTVIGKGKGTSICGSGIVDATAVMRKAGIIDDTGLILDSSHNYAEHIVEVNNANAFQIPKTDVLITQEDIRSIQLAKSAIHAGLITLIDGEKLKKDDIDTLILAGGFGGCVNTESAAAIGLIPDFLKDKTVISGNGALRGASLLLLYKKTREAADRIAMGAKTTNLTTSSKFFDEYISGMSFY